jgi:hypothetical protein
MQVQEIQVLKRELLSARCRERARAALAEGQVRLGIDLFALTANNMTYAVLGDELGYWEFFPTGDPDWGQVPAWGFATVRESRQPGIDVGQRFYGLLPMASEVVVQPTRVSRDGFFDGAPHRAAQHPAYKRFAACAADPLYREGTEDPQAVLRPLFITSWLVADLVRARPLGGRARVLVAGASSKTAYGTALELRGEAMEVVGLTSTRNADFCRALGCYDDVAAYEDLAALDPAVPTVYVDYAGNAALRGAVHGHFKHLSASIAIGYTHAGALGGTAHLPGPPVTSFFAPDAIRERSRAWGGEEFTGRLAAAYARFSAFCLAPGPEGRPLMATRRHHGPAQVEAAYLRVARGELDPSIASTCSLGA